MTVAHWIEACHAQEIELEDVLRFDYEDRTFAIYRTEDNKYYATDGYCTHQKVHLAGGMVFGTQIECPKHNGRLDFTTGEAKRAPICQSIKTYPVKIQEGKIYIQLD